MDVLADVLSTVRVQATCYGRLIGGAPWGVQVEKSHHPKLHFVVEGQCFVGLEGQEPIKLGSGDLICLPQGHAHWLGSSADVETLPLSSLVAEGKPHCSHDRSTLTVGNGAAQSVLICGQIAFDESLDNPLLRVLPPMILIPGDAGQAVHWLEHTLRFMACEASSGRPGAETVINRLADILFVQVVRGHLANREQGDQDWLRALTDPQIGAALALIHESPNQAWTVASLASGVGMSRSSFASRFCDLVGEPPLQYVTRWRMQKAACLLRDGNEALARVAGNVGYESEAAFSKAFKRWSGIAPGGYRRRFRDRSISASAAE